MTKTKRKQCSFFHVSVGSWRQPIIMQYVSDRYSVSVGEIIEKESADSIGNQHLELKSSNMR